LQAAYETFGCNDGNVFFIGIDKGNNNASVIEFDELHGIEYPSVSGTDGGGNPVHWDYEIQATPTIVVITPNKAIAVHQIYPPNVNNLVDSIQQVGGIVQPCVTSIPENSFTELITIRPNPVKGKAYIDLQLTKAGIVELNIFNLTGQKIFTNGRVYNSAGRFNMEVDLSQEPEGFYFVQYQDEYGELHTKKFIVSN